MTKERELFLYHDGEATAVNRKPSLAGSYRIEAEAHKNRLCFWPTIDNNGLLVARGYVETRSISQTLRDAFHTSSKILTPKGITLEVGEAVLPNRPDGNDGAKISRICPRTGPLRSPHRFRIGQHNRRNGRTLRPNQRQRNGPSCTRGPRTLQINSLTAHLEFAT